MQTEVQKQVLAKKQPLQDSSIHSKLKAEALRNPVFQAVAEGFAVRERTRNQVTIHSLMQKMDKEGYKEFTREDYVGVLKFLANLGFGRLDLSPKGKVRALKGIETTLQSIGMAAINNGPLKKAAKTNKFKSLPKPKVNPPVEKAHAKTMAGKIGMDALNKKYKAELVVHYGSEKVVYELIKGITPQQIGSFFARYYNSTEG